MCQPGDSDGKRVGKSRIFRRQPSEMIISRFGQLVKCVYCVYSNSCNDVPRVAQRYGTIAAHTRSRASVLVVFVVFGVLLYSFAGLIRRTPPPTFSETAIIDRHSDTTIFQLRAHWVRISWSIGSEKSFGHVPRWESNPRLPACKASNISTKPGSPLQLVKSTLQLIYYALKRCYYCHYNFTGHLFCHSYNLLKMLKHLILKETPTKHQIQGYFIRKKITLHYNYSVVKFIIDT